MNRNLRDAAYQRHARFAQPPNSRLANAAFEALCRECCGPRQEVRAVTAANESTAAGLQQVQAEVAAWGARFNAMEVRVAAMEHNHQPMWPIAGQASGAGPGPAPGPAPAPPHVPAHAPAPAPVPARRREVRHPARSYVVRAAPGAPAHTLAELSVNQLHSLYTAFHGRMPAGIAKPTMTPERMLPGALGGPDCWMRVPHVRGTRSHLRWRSFVAFYNRRRTAEGLIEVAP